ncbi:type II toxin-antitoxin system RelE/ParE family toxin [Neorhizobium huautlense]|nr:type II toxin-antitoxin system RelE/ParE family toxin [Neorhizobium huautlense]
MTVRFTDRSSIQIDKALTYVSERSPSGAERIAIRISEAIELLANQPRAGQRTSRQSTRRLVMSPYPYVIFYRLDGEDVVVTRFRHTSRRPEQ